MPAAQQLPLFDDQPPPLPDIPFPSTRYQGSKRKLLDWIWANAYDLPFDSVLDVFGGTGAVSHLFKRAGKRVIYNDALKFNWNIGQALIANPDTRLDTPTIDQLLAHHPELEYPNFIQQTFSGIYFTDEENAWLDRVLLNIEHLLANPMQQALARFALFQACIIKRPYNLFHRANLYMRTAQVERSFGNKTTWDTPFETHFRAFAEEANRAVFDNGCENQALNLDAMETPTGADLVYLDPPYISRKGVGVDYRDFYHFLEGMMDLASWSAWVDYDSKHRRLLPQPSPWVDPQRIGDAFEALVKRHRDSMLMVSYRDDGIPSRKTLVEMLGGYKSSVRVATLPQQYVLSKRASHELLIVAT
jgi:adenine-specific DNA methylase